MGFNTGLSCLAFCVPIILPYSASVQKPNWFSGLTLAAFFSVGRLISYAALLLIFVFLKSFLPNNILTEALVTLITGAIVILSALATFGILNWSSGVGSHFCRMVSGSKTPFYLGILMGFRPCPALISALAFTLTLTTPIKMSMFLVSFWLATSVLVLFLGSAGGGLAYFFGQRISLTRVRRISGIAMMVIGLVLVLQAIGLFTYL